MNVDVEMREPEIESDPCGDRPGSPQEPLWKRERVRTSPEDGGLLARPSLHAALDQTQQNATLIAEYDCDLQGRSIGELRSWAREEIVRGAAQFTSRLIGEDVPLPDSGLLVMDGHQPQLFHPGVWAKNFAIGGLSDRLGAIPLHLIVDNDTFTKTSIEIPAGSRENPKSISVEFDHGHPDRPWEGARVNDPALFRAFAADVHSLMAHWDVEPLIGKIWPTAVAHSQEQHSLPFCLTAARHVIEREWGLSNLELPMSEVCNSRAFLWFASHLIANARCFREVYNSVLAEYRQVYRIRSHTHPVPELKQNGDWVETPFWIWREGEYLRNRVFVRMIEGRTELAAEDQSLAFLDLCPESDADDAVEQLQELSRQGYHLRSRALTTTLFARLLLSDLFIHGIGGAKYDEMTDRIIMRFFGLRPPGFLTLSATHFLPFAEPFETTSDAVGAVERQLRDLEHNPDRLLFESGNPEVRKLIDEKESLVAEQREVDLGTKLGATRREHHQRGYARFRRLRAINDELQNSIVSERRRLTTELAARRGEVAANEFLKSREYSFCLFPEEALRGSMDAIRTLQDS